MALAHFLIKAKVLDSFDTSSSLKYQKRPKKWTIKRKQDSFVFIGKRIQFPSFSTSDPKYQSESSIYSEHVGGKNTSAEDQDDLELSAFDVIHN